ncbi:MAG: UDP-N-acetylmuramate dehydrogenase [Acidobacteria bacterium]|nr:UDP-N-acetylmuramate dehydrogenase [Acidobacteriota bacterium]
MTFIPALEALPEVAVQRGVPLSQYTRFGIGGPADFLIESPSEEQFLKILQSVQNSGSPYLVLGAGTNLIVQDTGYRGVILRFTGNSISSQGGSITVAAGAVLQHLVDFSIQQGMEGLHTMTGIPGWVGAAIYGNAGAYGHSISEFVQQVRFFDGTAIRTFDQSACQFTYRESVFKRHKEWIILSASLQLPTGKKDKLAAEAARILETRNAKYPPEMKCAGSIFKNLLWSQLSEAVRSQVPPTVVREGKVPSAWFLEQVDAKGIKLGGIVVASYHANLIYNEGHGTAAELCTLIRDLKARVKARFGFDLEEEVQYVG